jgi:hypothetical protein
MQPSRVIFAELSRQIANFSHVRDPMVIIVEDFAAMGLQEEEDPYVLPIGRADFVSNPFQTLQTLTDLFDKGIKDSLKIKFIGEKGQGQGPTREFVSELFNGVCDKLEASAPSQSLFRPHGEEHRQVYVNLGKLMSFCLNAKGDLLLGRRLHPSVWVGLTTYSELTPPLEVFKAMYSLTEKDQDILAGVQKSLDSSDEDIQEMAQEMIHNALYPIIAMREGMEAVAFEGVDIADVLLMTPDELARALEGTLDVEEVISKLTFRSFNETQKEWVKKWIRSFDEAKMKQFLYAMSGISALGKKELTLGFSSNQIQSATCHHLLFLPEACRASEELFIGALEAAIAGKKSYTKK